jgi:UDP-N-acetylglucosamine 4,6-dehydratase
MNNLNRFAERAFSPEIKKSLDGAGILVTGGTGSFGQAFVKELLNLANPSRLVIYSRDEQKHFDMEQRLNPSDHPCLRYFVGDVRDLGRLKRAMVGIDYVIHAAALKHVPIAEYNPIEAIKTNIIGGENVINAAIETGVRKVIALSTDKAANPINLYGATKLCSDKLFVAANNFAGGEAAAFSVVRYGNVLGSRGSVVPLFRRLVEEKRPALPITDPRMTRFWITLRQGVHFVLNCMADMRGGEIFVPRIPSMKLTDLIDVIAPGYPTRVTGIRPGEKLHEVMITCDDAINTLEFYDCYLIKPVGVLKLRDTVFSVNGEFGKPVDEEFEFSSASNDWWLSGDELTDLLRDQEGA